MLDLTEFTTKLTENNLLNLNGRNYQVINCSLAAEEDILKLFMYITLGEGKIIKIAAESVELKDTRNYGKL